MALASIFGTNLFRYDPAGVIEFYDACPEVRESFAQASEWTGYSVESLLRQNVPVGADQDSLRAVAIAVAAGQLGIQDMLVEQGLRPDVVGGVSLGGLVSSCIAGAIGRRQLLEYLARRGESWLDAVEDERPQGVAAVYLPAAADAEPFYRPALDGVFLAGDFGFDASGKFRVLLLTGYRDALARFAAGQPDGIVNIAEDVQMAVHSPLLEQGRVLTEANIKRYNFADPEITLCSSLERKTLTTADEVRQMFLDNVVKPVSVPQLTAGMKDSGTKLGLVLGNSPIMNALQYPFPVVFVDSSKALPAVIAAVFEHGVTLRRD